MGKSPINGHSSWLLVVKVTTPLKNMTSSTGMINYSQLNGKMKFMSQTKNMKVSWDVFPIYGKMKKIPNHHLETILA